MKVGILGAGQLSRMLALAGLPLGISFHFYESRAEHCVGQLGRVFNGSYDNQNQLTAFAEGVDVITYENENIPPETLAFLAGINRVCPDQQALRLSQDRLLEKDLFQQLGIGTARYQAIESQTALLDVLSDWNFPLFIKKRRGGYDGKGQKLLTHRQDIEALPADWFRDAIIEEYVEFDREFSLIAVRNALGELRFYDLSENRHRDGILFRTVNRPNDPVFTAASEMVGRLLNHLNYVGVFAMEFFQQGDRILANEMAPRVHNSGHWTIEGAETSQFENHLRAICNWPLGKTDSLGAATLYNILGQFPDREQLLRFNALHVHDYQKTAAPGRKLGHVTLMSQQSHSYPKALENLLF